MATRNPLLRSCAVLLSTLFVLYAVNVMVTGTIIGVSDGDTVTLLTKDNKQIKIRLHGIDCPEKNQAFGMKAKQFTSNLVFNQEVSLEIFSKDQYGRTVGEIFLPDGRSLNKELVRAGYAWQYQQFSKDPKLKVLEIDAKKEKRGLWADPNPIPPWEFRRQNKKSSNQITKPQIIDKNATVYFNVKSYKIHCPSCRALSNCRNCVETSLKDAIKRGGVPCKICGGCL